MDLWIAIFLALTSASPAPDALRVDADRARDVLVPACGSCHRSDLPTAVPGALAVFDLKQDAWWATIKPEQYDALLHRARGIKDGPAEDQKAIEDFIARLRSTPPTPEP